VSCPQPFDHDLLPRYAGGELSEAERNEFEQHVLECPDCCAALESLEAARSALATAPAARRPPAWAQAAALALACLAGGAWLGSRSQPRPATGPFRGSGAGEALAVEQSLELEPGSTATARRAVSLLGCPAPSQAASEQLFVRLLAPGGAVLLEQRLEATAQGRVHVVLDLAQQPSGAWQLEVLRRDPAGRPLEARRCSFELR